nr:Asp23/Gls24 family envelope stress response protein [Arthrobacter polaris]UIK89467.1 Asp23/Gls24 family envelope stress response protein [Arthrobacter polaris]
MALDDTPRLGCGRSIDQIWAGMEQPPTAHEQHCQQCQTAKAQLERLQKATRTLAHNDQQDPELKPRTRVTNGIMDVARAEVRRGRRLLVRTTENGTIEISEQALISLIRVAATKVPGIHSRRCRIEIDAGTGSQTEKSWCPVPATRVVINLRVAAAAGIEIPAAVKALREQISKILPASMGVKAGAINITVEDLYDV